MPTYSTTHQPPPKKNPPHIPMAENNIKKENILFEEVSLTWICFEGSERRAVTESESVCVSLYAYSCAHTKMHAPCNTHTYTPYMSDVFY